MPGCSREGTVMGSATILLLQGPNTPLPLQPQTTSFHVHLRTAQFKRLGQALRAHFAHWMITATSSGLKNRKKLFWFRHLSSKRQRLYWTLRDRIPLASRG